MGGMYQGPRIFIFPFVLNHYGIKRHANNELLTCYKVFFIGSKGGVFNGSRINRL